MTDDKSTYLEEALCKMNPDQYRRHFQAISELRCLGYTDEIIKDAAVLLAEKILRNDPSGIEVLSVIYETLNED